MAVCEALHDVAIVGAGPAGAALARRLASQGRDVIVLEASHFESPRVGETLSPEVQGQLRELGVWEHCLALNPLPSWGTISVWGDDGVQSQSHLTNPWGCGWHVDRTAFDRLLAQSAADAGATLREGHRVRRVEHDGRAWCLHTDGASASLRARVLVDATGRCAQIARRLGAQPIAFDPLVGIALVWRGSPLDTRQPPPLLVEAVPEGWWYSAPLPAKGGHAVVTMLMTDADGCAHRQLHQPGPWHTALARTEATRRRLDDLTPPAAPRVHLAHSQRLRRCVDSAQGPWLAIGDAALAVDPLSGSGVLRALRQATEAAVTIAQLLDRPESAHGEIEAFESARDGECTQYLIERAQQYRSEQRFDSPFWRCRRRGRAVPDQGGAVGG